MGKAGHRFIGDQKLRLCGHSAGELEFAHFDLGKIARQVARLIAKSDLAKECGTSLFDFVRGMMTAASCRHRVEERDPNVVGERQADERPRELKTPRQTQMRALMRLQTIEP